MATPSPRQLMNELGKPGLKQVGGILFEEYNPKLRGRQAVKIYTEMANNAVVAAMLFAVESILRSVEWRTEPVSDDELDLAAAQFVEECRLDMSHTWEDFISEVLTMLQYGWSYFEQVYKLRLGPDETSPKFRSKFNDGRIGWRKFAPRGQETLNKWDIKGDGGIAGMWQENIYPDMEHDNQAWMLKRIPIQKALLFRTTSVRNNPEGRSILRAAYEAYYYAKKLRVIEAVGVERSMAGMPIAYVPLEILAAEKDEAAQATYDYVKDVVTRTKRDEQEGIIWPRAYDESGNDLYGFELMSAAGHQAKSETGAMIQRYNQEILGTLLADFIMLGHESVGSFALSSDKTELFTVALTSWLDNIAEVVNRFAIPQLMELNGFPVEQYPRITHGDVERADLAELGGYIQALSGSGAPLFPDLPLEEHLRDVADLPEIDLEAREENLAQAEEAAMMGAQPGMAPNGNGAGGQPGEMEDMQPIPKPPAVQ